MPHPLAKVRRMFELVEPIATVTFSEVPNEAFLALGMRNYWDGYFAGRAAPLGLAPAEVVHAVFYNFADGEVARHIPDRSGLRSVMIDRAPQRSVGGRSAQPRTARHRGNRMPRLSTDDVDHCLRPSMKRSDPYLADALDSLLTALGWRATAAGWYLGGDDLPGSVSGVTTALTTCR
jgi:hypothetical protein